MVTLSAKGHQLILDWEVGGGGPYYDRFLRHPEWPGDASGITVGVGYDCGYARASVIRGDWAALPEAERLAAVAGVSGKKAKARLFEVLDILVPWPTALDVFDRVDVARQYALAQNTFKRGFDQLRPNAQAALVSLVFNRGSGMTGPARAEMRQLRDDSIPRADYNAMAAQVRHMKRLWIDTTPSLAQRREAEAILILTP